jgi:hypothetical protein
MEVAQCAGRGQSLRAQRLPSPAARKEARAQDEADAFEECGRPAGRAVGWEQHRSWAARLRRIRRDDLAAGLHDVALRDLCAGAPQELPLNRSLTQHLLS